MDGSCTLSLAIPLLEEIGMQWIKLLALAMVVVLVGSCCFGQAPSKVATKTLVVADPGYSITLTPPADPVRVGSPINVIVTVKNISNKEIYWESEFSDTAYRAFTILLTKNGSEVETTAFHRKVRSKQRAGDPPEVEHGGSILSTVAPGKSFTFTIDLERLYQITEPGVYVLDISRLGNDHSTVVRAEMSLKVVP
jgi:hypothetical protein